MKLPVGNDNLNTTVCGSHALTDSTALKKAFLELGIPSGGKIILLFKVLKTQGRRR